MQPPLLVNFLTAKHHVELLLSSHQKGEGFSTVLLLLRKRISFQAVASVQFNFINQVRCLNWGEPSDTL